MIEVTKPRAIALGYFDGVHLGHRALMQKAVERAKQIGGTSAVFTFDVHPDSVVMGRQVPLLTANAYRREEIKQLGGVDEVIFSHFDERMQHMDWRDFIHKLLIGPAGSSPAATTALATRVRATPKAWRSSARRPVSVTTASRTSR